MKRVTQARLILLLKIYKFSSGCLLKGFTSSIYKKIDFALLKINVIKMVFTKSFEFSVRMPRPKNSCDQSIEKNFVKL